MFLAANVPSIQPRRQPRTYFFNHLWFIKWFCCHHPIPA